jgi:hypothetical protein
MLNHAKTWAKFLVQRFGIVTNNIETAAFCWTLGTERADDNMTSSFHRAGDLADICGALLGHGKEVKYRTVMPHAVGTGLQMYIGNIGDEPMNTVSKQAQPFPGHVESGLRNVKNTKVFVSSCHEVINKRGFATTDVDDRC